MGQSDQERRRGRRVPVKGSLVIRRVDGTGKTVTPEHMTQNVSLGGVYFETDAAAGFSADDLYLASVFIPESERRAFPFARLAGRGRVVRIQELSPSQSRDGKRIGIAIEFSPGATALTAIPSSG